MPVISPEWNSLIFTALGAGPTYSDSGCAPSSASLSLTRAATPRIFAGISGTMVDRPPSGTSSPSPKMIIAVAPVESTA